MLQVLATIILMPFAATAVVFTGALIYATVKTAYDAIFKSK